jgi:hypothetical protein
MNYLQKQAQNKKRTVSKILGINLSDELNKSSSSSPNIEIIKKLKERAVTDDPMLRLSITDYELMCKDDKALEIMSTIFEVDKNKLKKICKYLDIFKTHINSSPETIKNKIKALKAPILKLPSDLRKEIVKVFDSMLKKKFILRRGIPYDKLEEDTLSSNINAIDFLIENPHLINWRNLSSNPKAIELLEGKFKEEGKLSKEELASMPNNQKIDWRNLSGNPDATELIKAKYRLEQISPEDTANLTMYERLDWRLLSGNPCAFDILRLTENRYKIDWVQLSRNPNPEAEVLLRAPENIQNTVWNPIQLTRDAVDLEGKTAEQDDIGYVNSKIRGWSNLSLDPTAIKLLIKRIAHEEALPKDELKKIIRINKINWNFMTQNPAIFI